MTLTSLLTCLHISLLLLTFPSNHITPCLAHGYPNTAHTLAAHVKHDAVMRHRLQNGIFSLQELSGASHWDSLEKSRHTRMRASVVTADGLQHSDTISLHRRDQNLQTFTDALGNMKAPDITMSADMKRPFEVAGQTFVSF